MQRYPIIDGDGHVLEPVDLWDKYIDAPYKSRAPKLIREENDAELLFIEGRLQTIAEGDIGNMQSVGIPNWDWRTQPMKEISYAKDSHPGGFDPHQRIKDMDIEGIDVAVLYPTIGLYFGAVEDRGLIAAICRAYNNWLADYCKPYPERLKGIAVVPLQYVDDAVIEMRRAVNELGFKGIFIRPNPYKGRNLDHPDYDPFWAEAERLGVPVAIHEGAGTIMPTVGAERFDKWFFYQIISHVFEQKLACLTVLGSGLLERFPKLKVVFLEAGCGWLPSWLERMDDFYEELSWNVPWLKAKPSEYFFRQCHISCEAGERMLPATIEALGDEHIIFASDYPHHDSKFPGAVAELQDREDISDGAKRKILAENAQHLYGL